MDRREFLESIAGLSALLPGLTLLPLRDAAFAAELHARAQAAPGLRTLTPELDATLSGVADILLPQTDTVGASAVGVNRFIDLLLTEAMLELDRDRFIEGLRAIDADCQASHGAPFGAATRALIPSWINFDLENKGVPSRTVILPSQKARGPKWLQWSIPYLRVFISQSAALTHGKREFGSIAIRIRSQ